MGVMNCAANTGDKNLAIITVKGIEGRLNKITVDVMCVCSVKKGKPVRSVKGSLGTGRRASSPTSRTTPE